MPVPPHPDFARTSTRASLGLTKIRKRDGRIVDFDPSRIANAIHKAMVATGEKDGGLAEKLAGHAVDILEERYGGRAIPSVEEIQDVVEKVLVENGLARVAKAYILYRQKRAEIRREKQHILEKEALDEVDKAFEVNALRVLKARYLKKDINGRLIESPKELFTRVATHVALPDVLYDERVFDVGGKQPVHEAEPFDPRSFEGKASIGRYKLNRYHLEALKRLYDRLNSEGKMKLSWGEFFGLLMEGRFADHEKDIEAYYDLMVSRKFMPNTPALANFGNVLGMGSACFVLDIEDSIESIMDTLKKTAVVFKAGGGMGYNFSKLRPEGDFVSSTSGVASGPISFMTLFDTMTEVIKQGGIRRGANMGILNIDHPDIEKFIKAKEGNKALRNFNISVLVMPNFWEHYESGKPYPLINPRTGEVVRYVDPKLLFDMMVYQAWESAEPGVIFFDNVNRYNPFLEALGPIVTTNPCGEVLLYPNESCNLGSVNVSRFVKEDADGGATFDWDGLKEAVILATRFLDNVVDVSKHPLKEIEETTLATRKIGLGVMGLADLLFELRLPYNSDEGRAFMEMLMEFINYWSKMASVELAKERGPMPLFEKSFYPQGRLPFRGFEEKGSWHLDWEGLVELIKEHGIRNAYTTVIAPTGSISMIAGCSNGIEPVYRLIYEKHVTVGSFYYVDPVFEKAMSSLGLFDEDLVRHVVESGGSVQRIPYIPEDIKRVFVTAMDISPEDHVKALAAFQKWTDSSISKTINFPAHATVEDVKRSYIMAHELGCKSITVFRDTSIRGQVYRAPKREERREPPQAQLAAPVAALPVQGASAGLPALRATPAKTRCPECGAELSFQEGCSFCRSCGWGVCSYSG